MMTSVSDETKRQDLPPGLWVVATPLGNTADLSARARAALECAQAVLCEDTRRTANLLSVLGLRSRMERFDAHAAQERVDELVRRLTEGESFALVSDAGTPGICDPGARLVRAAREARVRITPVPGPSAVAALLSVAGFESEGFVFHGFFPRKSSERDQAMDDSLASPERVHLWFESPNRVVESLEHVARAMPEAELVAAKELTKMHERFFWGSAPEAALEVRQEIGREGALGEWCFALRLPERPRTTQSSDWVKALQCLVDCQVSAPEAAKRVSQIFGVARNEAYETYLRLSGKK
jgi:16S rRNA (cytidine1402-2'-O)-methyltransferase